MVPTSATQSASKGVIVVGRRLLIAYAAIVLGPLVVVAAAFALRDLLTRRGRPSSAGNGHAEAEALEHTVEEVQAT
jgi:hypothetical protein